MTPDVDGNLRAAIETFFKGSKIFHVGHDIHDLKIQDKGIALLEAGINAIDSQSPVGRDVLLAYLDNEDPDVAVAAAGALLWSHTELAKEHLRHIHETCVSSPRFSALNILCFKGKLNVALPDPRFPEFDLPPGMDWLEDDTKADD